MQALVDWVRSVLILYFLMMIMLYFTAGDSYKKFIRFFMGLVLALTLLAPLLRLLGKEEAFSAGIAYESFRQDMEQAQFDFGHLQETESAVYRSHYEQALEEQFLADAKKQLLQIKDISVSLNGDYEFAEVRIKEELYGDGEELKNYLMTVYGLEEGQVVVQ